MKTAWVLIQALRLVLLLCVSVWFVIGMSVTEPTVDTGLALASMLAVAIVAVPSWYMLKFCTEWYDEERTRIIRANRRVKPNYTA